MTNSLKEVLTPEGIRGHCEESDQDEQTQGAHIHTETLKFLSQLLRSLNIQAKLGLPKHHVETVKLRKFKL